MYQQWPNQTVAEESLSRSSRGFVGQAAAAFRVLFYLALLPAIAMLSDCSPFLPATAYRQAQQNFVQGHLEAAQSEAERGYEWSLHSDIQWSRRFQILAATAMLWRSSYDEVLHLLDEPSATLPSPPAGHGEEIDTIGLEVQALIHLARLPEAVRKLEQADRLCQDFHLSECGSISLAHGLLYLNLDKVDEARTSLLKAVDMSRKSNDKVLEGAALLNLGSVLVRQEHYDEAIRLYQSSSAVASSVGAELLTESALSGQGLAYDRMGNPDKAIDLYTAAERSASSIQDVVGEVYGLISMADVQSELGQSTLAESSDTKAIKLGTTFHQKALVVTASEDLAQVYIDEAQPENADRFAGEALILSQQTGSQIDVLYCHMLQGEAAALRHDWPRAEALLQEVVNAPGSQQRMRWSAEHTLATSYEAQGQPLAAERAYKAAIALVEGARADLHQERSQLTFLNNAARIYDDYIHFLVAQRRTDEALEAADWSRARTLQQGLGLIPASASVKPAPLKASAIARSTNTTLLFYWMGEKQSYLWAVTPDKTTLITLPVKSEIVTRIERYRRTLLAVKDPLRANGGHGDTDGRELYDMLVAPATGVIAPGLPVVLFTDGEMTQLNFETLVVGSATPHFWIEDATVSSAPSIRLFATKNRNPAAVQDKLLLIGDSVSADPAYPRLPLASLEIERVRANFRSSDQEVFSEAQATPHTYMAAKPEQFSYIHFVAHASAITADPLESAVILSRNRGGADDSYKLYAREILQHPISARLVTISACNSSGNKFYAGEGVVGLSWAFLRAGAHNTIGALWEVSDASTPDLMEHLYAGLEQGRPPATALREAKLSLLRSGSNFSRPFYWAPFELYSGR